ncbi:MAG: SGNH/GDSL hydrolase family protein [Verrucomicrobiota bacterium]
MFLSLVRAGSASDAPAWVEPMKKVHEGFQGTSGYVVQLGDSITYSMAFWSPMGWSDPATYLSEPDGLPARPKGGQWKHVIHGVRDKGGKHGNYSGWRTGNILRVMDGILASKKPETAIVMIGTNDSAGGKVPEAYEKGLRAIVEKCLAVHCIPILNTIPPRRKHPDAVLAVNRIVRRVAEEHRIPLVDYYQACLDRRPGQTWQGTVISRDGIHPSGGKTNDYSEENLKMSGYALRNWMNFLTYRQLYFHVLHPDEQ